MDLEMIISQIAPLDQSAMEAARARQDILTQPRGSLGRLEALSVQVAGITGNPLPNIHHKGVIVMAAWQGPSCLQQHTGDLRLRRS